MWDYAKISKEIKKLGGPQQVEILSKSRYKTAILLFGAGFAFSIGNCTIGIYNHIKNRKEP